MNKRSIASLCKPAVADITFFLLEQKEPKIQESRIPQPGGLQAFARLGGYFAGGNLASLNLDITFSLNFSRATRKVCDLVRKGPTKRAERSGLS